MDRIPMVAEEPLSRALLESLLYADLFDYPLSAAEIHRYLPGLGVTRDVLDARLAEQVARRTVVEADGLYALAGREAIIPLRRRRQALAARQWTRARRYARLYASMPFVRLVAVSGTLAVDNVGPDDDTDFLIVTAPDRLWLCRALLIAIGRVAKLLGHELCPNYLLSERALEIGQRDLFTARELAQLVPLYGSAVYARLRAANAWIREFLPNAEPAPPAGTPPRDLTRGSAALQRIAERAMAGWLGERLERWERARKLAKFAARAAESGGSAVITADCCKGHFEGHGRRIMRRFEARLRAYGIDQVSPTDGAQVLVGDPR